MKIEGRVRTVDVAVPEGAAGRLARESGFVFTYTPGAPHYYPVALAYTLPGIPITSLFYHYVCFFYACFTISNQAPFESKHYAFRAARWAVGTFLPTHRLINRGSSDPDLRLIT